MNECDTTVQRYAESRAAQHRTIPLQQAVVLDSYFTRGPPVICMFEVMSISRTSCSDTTAHGSFPRDPSLSSLLSIQRTMLLCLTFSRLTLHTL